MSDGMVLLGVVAATCRLTWLLAVDEFPPVKKMRDWIARKFGEDSAIAYLSTCVWCVSVWVGSGVVAVTIPFASVPLPAWTALGASAFAGTWATYAKSIAQRTARDEAIELVETYRREVIVIEQAEKQARAAYTNTDPDATAVIRRIS